METVTFEAAFLEEAVCKSKEKELHLYCNAESGRGWVQVGTRRFVGKTYIEAARRLHQREKLTLKHSDAKREVFELGHHACTSTVK